MRNSTLKFTRTSKPHEKKHDYLHYFSKSHKEKSLTPANTAQTKKQLVTATRQMSPYLSLITFCQLCGKKKKQTNKQTFL